MGVERSEVRFDVEEGRAKRAARDIKREMDGIEKEAKEAQREVDAARKGGTGLNERFNRLLDRAKAKGIQFRDEDLVLSEALKIDRGGIRLREDYKKGKGSGFAAPALRVGFGAMIAGHAGGSTLNTIADYRDLVNEFNLDSMEALHEIGLRASRGVHERLGSESILRGILRLSGERNDVIDTAFDLAFSRDGRSEVDHIIAMQAENRRRFLRWQEEQGKQKRKEEQKRQEALDAAMQKIDQHLADRLAKIRITNLPIRVSDEMFTQMMWMARDGERRTAERQQRELTTGAGS